MNVKVLIASGVSGTLGALLLPSQSGHAATAVPYKAPLNAYGQPDLEGTWTNATLTALERAKEYGARKTMTAQEVAKSEGGIAQLLAADNAPRDPKFKTEDLPHECGLGVSGAGFGYNAAWIDPGTRVMRVNGEPRSSFISDPATGTLPPYKAGVKAPGM